MKHTSNKTLAISDIIFAHFQALRPHQWTKNLIIFAASLFSFKIDQSLFSAVIAFVLFSATSSSFYLINDVIDVKSDRRHPTKSNRPIASGKVKVSTAIFLATSLLCLSLLASISISWKLFFIIGLYAFLQVCYNFKLKHLPILDIISISIGFVLRAYAGAVSINVHLSSWFILCTAMLALFLAIEKRRAELRLVSLKSGGARPVLRYYSMELLNKMESIVTSSTVISYALWSSGPQVGGASTYWMMLTNPFVLYGIFRYQMLSDSGRNDSSQSYESSSLTERPDEVLLSDRPILWSIILWSSSCFTILWLKSISVIS